MNSCLQILLVNPNPKDEQKSSSEFGTLSSAVYAGISAKIFPWRTDRLARLFPFLIIDFLPELYPSGRTMVTQGLNEDVFFVIISLLSDSGSGDTLRFSLSCGLLYTHSWPYIARYSSLDNLPP